MPQENTNTRNAITIVVVFYNNRREAERTLYTMSAKYQRNISADEYNVIAIDNGSSKPLNKEMVESFGPNFSYHYFNTKLPSPCAALNWGIQQAQTPYVMCVIDGAHMLTPALLSNAQAVFRTFEDAFVYTVPFHLGQILQNDSMLEGYNQTVEDALLSSIDWKENGYKLFTISEIESANHSFFTGVVESNGFIIKKETLLAHGGFDERFVSSGGGLANLDVFRTIIEDEKNKPVALVGEATFHQFHGGVSTNVKRKIHPIGEYKKEYKEIRGKSYQGPTYTPFYWGHFPKGATNMMPHSPFKDCIRLARQMTNRGKVDSALDLLGMLSDKNPYNPEYCNVVAHANHKAGNLELAKEGYRRVMELVPNSLEAYMQLVDILMSEDNPTEGIAVLKEAEEQKIENPRLHIKFAQLYAAINQDEIAQNYTQKAFDNIEEDTFMPLIYIELAKMLEKERKFRKALNVLEKGIKSNPENFQLYLNMGRINNKSNNPERAAECFTKAIQYHPGKAHHLYISLSNSYKKMGKLSEAYEALKKANIIDPSDQRVKNQLSQVKAELAL